MTECNCGYCQDGGMSATIDEFWAKKIAIDKRLRMHASGWKCPECGEKRFDDDRVLKGMKCEQCAY